MSNYKSRRSTYPFVILCGASGVGKSTVRKLLAPQMSAASLGRDDFGGDWNAVYDELDLSDRAVVECVKLPRALRRKADERHARIVHLTAPIEVRRKRLQDRGESRGTIDHRLAEDSEDLGYGAPVRVDLEVDTTRATPQQIATELAQSLP